MPNQAARQRGHFGSITSATVGSRAKCSAVRNPRWAWVHRHPDSAAVCIGDLLCESLAVTATGLLGTIDKTSHCETTNSSFTSVFREHPVNPMYLCDVQSPNGFPQSRDHD